jgi:hypothetical protein
LRFDFRALLLAGRLPWLAFLIFRCGFAMLGNLQMGRAIWVRENLEPPMLASPVSRVKVGNAKLVEAWKLDPRFLAHLEPISKPSPLAPLAGRWVGGQGVWQKALAAS